MRHQGLNRRDFTRVGMAAFGGMMAGVQAGCGSSSDTPAPDGSATDTTDAVPAGETSDATDPAAEDAESTDDAMAATDAEKHLCRGLNDCKGQGKGAENECAGQGDCATVASHYCGGQNDCKGLGGCGEHPAENECKGQGHCAVPLMDSAWDKVRLKFETDMAAENKQFGDAPPKPAES